MSFVTTDLPNAAESTPESKLKDSTAEELGLSSSSELPCSCDVCSFNKLKEMERTLPPGLPMPYFSSWTTSQFSQTNIHHPALGAHLAPRTGYEQPFWHRPCYFGWQYVTSASHVTHHASFHHPENIQSMAHHFSRYHATKYHDTGCHAAAYHAAPPDLANGSYHDTATENRLGRVLGGVAYDHGEFPKIVSVHSMAETPEESSATDCHGNDCNGSQSESAHSENPLTESKNSCDDITQKSTDYSISTILDLPSASPVHSDKDLSEIIAPEDKTRIKLEYDEHEPRTELDVCISAEDESVKVKISNRAALDSAYLPEELSNTAPTDCNSGPDIPSAESPKLTCEQTSEDSKCPSTSTHIPPLKIRKNALILHRVRRIKKIQKRLKHEQSERKKVRFLKKIEFLQNEIELLTNSSPPRESTGKDGSPSTASPVKTSNLAPNKDTIERGKNVDARFAERETQDWKAELSVDFSVGEHWSSKRPKREMSGDGFRMNLFEKLGFWSENSSSDVSSSGLSDSISSDSSSDSQNSEVVEDPVEKDSKKAFERKGKLDGVLAHSQQPLDFEGRQKFKENVGNFSVKSADSNPKDTLHIKLAGNLCSLRKAYNSSKEELKRKCELNVVINSLSAKKRCKTLPRKVVWKYGTRPLVSDQERQKTVELVRQENSTRERKDSCLAENMSNKPFAANLNIAGDVTKCLSIKPEMESSASDDSEGCWVYDDDILQRECAIRKTKISDLLRKQEGLLQTIQKMATKPLPRD